MNKELDKILQEFNEWYEMQKNADGYTEDDILCIESNDSFRYEQEINLIKEINKLGAFECFLYEHDIDLKEAISKQREYEDLAKNKNIELRNILKIRYEKDPPWWKED